MRWLDLLPADVRARFERKRRAYSITFLGADGKPLPHAATVLADLKRFCGITRGGLKISPITRMLLIWLFFKKGFERGGFLQNRSVLKFSGSC